MGGGIEGESLVGGELSRGEAEDELPPEGEVGGGMLSSCSGRVPRTLMMLRRALYLARSFVSDIVISLVCVCT